MTLRVVYYLNQFFAQKGGEEMAHIPMEVVEGSVGVGSQINTMLKDKAEVTHTIICGDSYLNENESLCCHSLQEILAQLKPDLVVAGPAFNAGRYGMACGTVAKVAHEMGDIEFQLFHIVEDVRLRDADIVVRNHSKHLQRKPGDKQTSQNKAGKASADSLDVAFTIVLDL